MTTGFGGKRLGAFLTEHPKLREQSRWVLLEADRYPDIVVKNCRMYLEWEDRRRTAIRDLIGMRDIVRAYHQAVKEARSFTGNFAQRQRHVLKLLAQRFGIERARAYWSAKTQLESARIGRWQAEPIVASAAHAQ